MVLWVVSVRPGGQRVALRDTGGKVDLLQGIPNIQRDVRDQSGFGHRAQVGVFRFHLLRQGGHRYGLATVPTFSTGFSSSFSPTSSTMSDWTQVENPAAVTVT